MNDDVLRLLAMDNDELIIADKEHIGRCIKESIIDGKLLKSANANEQIGQLAVELVSIHLQSEEIMAS